VFRNIVRTATRDTLIKIVWQFRWTFVGLPPRRRRQLSSKIALAYGRRKARAIAQKRRFAIQGVSKNCHSWLSRSRIIFPRENHEPRSVSLIELSSGLRHEFSCNAIAVPPVWLYCMRDVILIGESDIVYHERQSVAPDHYLHADKVTREERMNTLFIDGNVVTNGFEHHNEVKQVDIVISCIGVPAINWAHWITEMLPKIAVFAKIPRLKSLPILVDADIPTTMLESVKALLGEDRKIVSANRGEPVYARKVWCVSPTAHVPYEYRTSNHVRFEDASFCESALSMMRAAVISAYGRSTSAAEKLYVKRRPNAARAIKNTDDVEEALRSMGFEIVEPDTLSFSEQVHAFSNARLIVGQAGAGLANFAFAPEGAFIITLTTLGRLPNYFYFAAIGKALGQNVMHFGCDRLGAGPNETLADELYVDIEGLKREITRISQTLHI